MHADVITAEEGRGGLWLLTIQEHIFKSISNFHLARHTNIRTLGDVSVAKGYFLL